MFLKRCLCSCGIWCIKQAGVVSASLVQVEQDNRLTVLGPSTSSSTPTLAFWLSRPSLSYPRNGIAPPDFDSDSDDEEMPSSFLCAPRGREIPSSPFSPRFHESKCVKPCCANHTASQLDGFARFFALACARLRWSFSRVGSRCRTVVSISTF